MKKRELIIKFTNNGIILLKDNNIYTFILDKAVENNRVINSESFIEKLSSIIEQQKMNNKLIGANISIIIDSTYNIEDLKLLNSLFKELSFNKIHYQNIIDLLKINNQEISIELNKTNFKIYYLTCTYQGNIYFNKPLPIIDAYLNSLINTTQINNIYIFGESDKIYKLSNFIEKKYHIPTYYYAHPKIYPLTELID